MSASAAAVDTPHRFQPLDGLRGIAILLVLIFHFSRTAVPMAPALHLYRTVLGIGWIGVDLFFVLSGFLITGILLESRADQHYYRNFYARRALRIAPVYYGFLLLLSLVIAPLLWHQLHRSTMVTMSAEEVNRFLTHQWVFWFFLTNLLIITKSAAWPPLWTGPFWSLAVEEQFYLSWPPLVRHLTTRTLALVACGAVIGAAIVRGFMDFVIHADGQAASFLTPARMDLLAGGALIAMAVRSATWKPRLARVCPFAVATGVVALCVVAFYRGGLDQNDIWMHTFGFPALVLLFGGTIGLSVTGSGSSSLNRALSLGFLRTFGKYSYTMYVVHLSLNWAMMHLLTRYDERFHSRLEVVAGIVYMIATTALSFAIAWLSWRFYESRFLRLKRYFPRSQAFELSQPASKAHDAAGATVYPLSASEA